MRDRSACVGYRFRHDSGNAHQRLKDCYPCETPLVVVPLLEDFRPMLVDYRPLLVDFQKALGE
jgi:hypothetical protein